MVKYTIAASVAFVHLAMLAQTSVALPIEQYTDGLESREISSHDEQELLKRDLEARNHPIIYGAVALGAAALAVHYGRKAFNAHKANQAAKNAQTSNQPPVNNNNGGGGGGPPGGGGGPPGGGGGPPGGGGGGDGGSGGGPPGGDPNDPGQRRRDLSELYARAFSDLDVREWDEIAKRYAEDVLDRRDLSDLYERGWDENEKRSFNEFEKRDWDDYEMEARGLDFDELDELD